MVVIHIIEVGTGGELLTLITVAELNVLQFLSFQMLHFIVLVVVARGLLMADGVAGIEAVVAVELIVDTKLRVEEVEVVVCPVAFRAVLVDVIVAGILHAVAHVTILQVYVSVETGEEGPRLFRIDVEVGLPCAVAVIFVSGIERVDLVLCPQHLTPMVADIFVPSAAEGSLIVRLVVVVDTCHHAVEVILHELLTCQVALELCVGQSVVPVVLVRLVLVVVAIAVGVVQRDV